MLFTGLGRSVLGETVPSIWVPPEAAQFLPIRTSQPVNNIHIYANVIQMISIHILYGAFPYDVTSYMLGLGWTSNFSRDEPNSNLGGPKLS